MRDDDRAAADLRAAVVASSEDAILTKDLDGRITGWNAAAERLYGWPAEQAVGRKVNMLLLDKSEEDEILLVLKDGRRTGSFEAVRRRRDGTLVDVSVSISPVHDRNGRVVGGAAIARDISHLKSREAALMRSELRYRTLASQLPDAAVYEYGHDLRILNAQGPLVSRLGGGRVDLAGRGVLELAAADTGAEAHYRAALAGEPRRFETEGDGIILDVDLVPLLDGGGEVTGALALARDVSSSRREERNLHFQAELLDRIDVAVVATDLDGRVTHWNRQAENYFERPREAALGRPVAETLGSGRETWQGERTIARSDGSDLPVLTTRSTMRDLGGDAIGFVDVSLDLTVTRSQQEEKAALQRRLHQSQKLDGIGRLAGGIAHDFNNLLTIVVNYADLLETQLVASDPACASYVAEIQEACGRATRLTRQLLVFGRRETVAPTPMDVNVALADMTTLLGPTIGENITLRIDPDVDLFPVCVDRSQLEQVLLNLALNARDSMPGGGVLSMATRNLDASRQVLITVTDTGCGMPADVVERAFEPFFTTKPMGSGTGLGLAIVYGIVKDMHGDATIESEPDRGTTIRITLPASREPALDPSMLRPGQVPRGRGECILVVEDEPSVRKTVVHLLSAAGYEVVATGSPEHALHEARAHDPALLLTDIVMPGMSGRELAARMSAELPALRILLMSGYTDDVVTRHGIRDRRLAFLAKPFTRQTLLQTVRTTLDAAPRDEAA
jgi:PAS domain S-box-containing protein